MSSLISNTILLVALALLVACETTQPATLEAASQNGQINSVGKTDKDCFEKAFGKDVVIRLDDKNKRIFITQEKVDKDSVKQIVQKAQACIAKDWKTDWAISFFSDKKFVGYMDEPGIEKYLKDGSWEKSYLAEYDNQTKILTLNPITNPEKIELDKNR